MASTEGPADESPRDLTRREFEAAEPTEHTQIEAYEHLFECEQRRMDLRNQVLLADMDLDLARRAIDDPALLAGVRPSAPRTADLIAEERMRAARVQARMRRITRSFYSDQQVPQPKARRRWAYWRAIIGAIIWGDS